MTKFNRLSVCNSLSYTIEKFCGRVVWASYVIGNDDYLVILAPLESPVSEIKILGTFRAPTTENSFNSLVHEIQLLLLFEV